MQEFFSQEPVPNIPSLTDIKFTEEDILKACAELKSSSAPGADGVPSALLKNCRQELKRPLFIGLGFRIAYLGLPGLEF